MCRVGFGFGGALIAVSILTARSLRQTFVHWPYPPEEVQGLMPVGLEA
ncbi:hypothetical protein FBY35_3782 [Streptomyces sp. SLBN-118]|nr:hypothetical protein FBY35_3782 [Streptomyces sp. SLBN-118]